MPALAVSLVALFFSFTGAGIAAGHYLITSTHEIKPTVLKALHGERGSQGPQGAQGAAGLRTYAGRSYVAHVEPGVWPAGVPLDQEVVMGYMVSRDDGWRMPDWLWEQVEPLLPAPPSHPLGCHNPRVANRDAMDAILMVLRTGMQWNALDASGICSSSSAHRRFQEWERAGIPIERPKPTRERPQGLC